jgi:hypothetical protein
MPAAHGRHFIMVMIAALLIQIILPLQFHLHHGEEPQGKGHEHVLDYHLIIDEQISDHEQNHDAHKINLSKDLLTKKDGDNRLSFYFIASLLIKISVNASPSMWSGIFYQPFSYFNYFILSPPLRAPPAV